MDIDYYELYANEQDAEHENNKLATVVVFCCECVVKWHGKYESIVVHKALYNFRQISVTGDRVLLNVKYDNSNAVKQIM